MSAPAAEIIHQLLADAGHIELSADWPGYISFMPSFPNQAVCVYDMSGEDDGRLMTGTKIDHPGIQIQVRSKTYSVGWSKASDIALALDNQIKTSVAIESDATYILHNASRRGTIHPIGVDEEDGQRRHYFTINAMVTISTQV